MKKKLLIIGASGHGKVVADIALQMNKWENVSFLDDNTSLKETMGLEVIGTIKDLTDFIDEYEVVVGIGSNIIRKNIYELVEKMGATIPTIIHPSAVIGKHVHIGPGTVIMAGTIINCCTRIGMGCIINTGATIDHDNLIEDFVHISPGVHIAGTVKIGYCSWLGIGSVVSNNIEITSECQVGAGSVIIRNLTESGVYFGIPAKKRD
ncbi:acetyltransferase [Ornithinibacillus halotolerans]|uniref:Acetyltransferase n=1 Tax=Ornithinibacillus halotolerans TaxID=1274357 RepID=A0A916RQ31_9BACI|nr:acetyltransferase [Ornithinibacillus halotolerans]GGA65118.1 acetyltransferase [Ornithinibacillus halotolerans]